MDALKALITAYALSAPANADLWPNDADFNGIIAAASTVPSSASADLTAAVAAATPGSTAASLWAAAQAHFTLFQDSGKGVASLVYDIQKKVAAFIPAALAAGALDYAAWRQLPQLRDLFVQMDIASHSTALEDAVAARKASAASATGTWAWNEAQARYANFLYPYETQFATLQGLVDTFAASSSGDPATWEPSSEYQALKVATHDLPVSDLINATYVKQVAVAHAVSTDPATAEGRAYWAWGTSLGEYQKCLPTLASLEAKIAEFVAAASDDFGTWTAMQEFTDMCAIVDAYAQSDMLLAAMTARTNDAFYNLGTDPATPGGKEYWCWGTMKNRYAA